MLSDQVLFPPLMYVLSDSLLCFRCQFFNSCFDTRNGFFFSKNFHQLRCATRCHLFSGNVRYGSATSHNHSYIHFPPHNLLSSLHTVRHCCNLPVPPAIGRTSFKTSREVSAVVFIFLCVYIAISYSGTASKKSIMLFDIRENLDTGLHHVLQSSCRSQSLGDHFFDDMALPSHKIYQNPSL